LHFRSETIAKYTVKGMFGDQFRLPSSFSSTAQFQSLATTLADYATALDLGQTPTALVTIPLAFERFVGVKDDAVVVIATGHRF
jgi:hypothetical protein